jgi:hypothetical protein
VNLVDEKYIAFLECRQQGRNVSRFFNRRTRSRFQLRTHLIGDNVRQRGLAQSWWSGQQDVVERLSPFARGRNIDPQVLFGFGLSNVLGETRGPQRKIVFQIFISGCGIKGVCPSGCFRHVEMEL